MLTLPMLNHKHPTVSYLYYSAWGIFEVLFVNTHKYTECCCPHQWDQRNQWWWHQIVLHIAAWTLPHPEYELWPLERKSRLLFVGDSACWPRLLAVSMRLGEDSLKIGRQHLQVNRKTLTSSISQLCISSTVLCFATSLSTPPSPPPTTSTLRDGKEEGDEV